MSKFSFFPSLFSLSALVLVLTPGAYFAQESDSLNLIEPIVLDAYQKTSAPESRAKSTAKISNEDLKQETTTLLSAINLNSGIQMEERSFGSYRLSVRGSTLRSPFGVRNVKVYLDEFLLSDASGDSYFQLIDPRELESLVVYKGPQGGSLGSENGGTVLLSTTEKDRLTLSLGSFGEFNSSLSKSFNLSKHRLSVFLGQNRSDGYREQSSLNKKTVLLKDRIRYHEKRELGLLLRYSSLRYETPGGITLEEWEKNPRSSRSRRGTSPSAIEQNASIENKTTLFGLSHRAKLSRHLSHFISLQGSYTHLENPFITNYEKRYERHGALRTYLSFEKNFRDLHLETRLGTELSESQISIKNYDNENGVATQVQNDDELKAKNHFFYLTQNLSYRNKLFLEAALSLESPFRGYRQNLGPKAEGARKFDLLTLPSLSVFYKLTDHLGLRGRISKGSSTPTLQELRASDQNINFQLSHESGWNKELGVSALFPGLFSAELTYFNFPLKNAITRELNPQGEEFFSNRGLISQKGWEFQMESTPRMKEASPFSFLLSGSYFEYKYEKYSSGEVDHSGKEVPGIPKLSLQGEVGALISRKLQIKARQFYRSKFALADSGQPQSKETWITNLHLSYPFKMENSSLSTFVSVDNIFNSKYSLGYDLNAFGGRYYNPAPSRGLRVGLDILF